MSYYAKVNTADPLIGFVNVGECLSNEQAEALGEEKIDELVKNGVLGVTRDHAYEAPKAQEAEPDADTSTQDEDEAAEDSEEDEDEEDGIEPGDMDDIVDEEPEMKATPRKGRKGKTHEG